LPPLYVMKKVTVGIIGAGYIGGVHAGILAHDERVQIAFIHDAVPERAQRLAATCNARVAENAVAVIANCDAVYITTPNTKHTELAIAAASSGKHVFCEKPMATSLADAQSVLAAAEKSTGVFQVGHNRRFAPVYSALKNILADNTPHSAHVKMNRGELLNPEWVGDPKLTGGFLYETTIHMFDMMRFLFGEVTFLHAIGSSHEYPEVDDFSVLLKFAGGMHATFASSADATWLFPFERVEVFCHHATIATREMEALIQTDGLDGRNTEHSMHALAKEEKWGYQQEDRSFIDAITNGSPPAVTALDGFKSVELVDACYRSVSSGEPVRF
jgi:myo-inositol 2-dehydrogenase / D-chiro-inositol 1-dehydrogenase